MDFYARDEVEAQADILVMELAEAGYTADSYGFVSYNEPVVVVARKKGLQVQIDVDTSADGRGFLFVVTWESNDGEGAFEYVGKTGPRSDAKKVIKMIKGLPTD